MAGQSKAFLKELRRKHGLGEFRKSGRFSRRSAVPRRSRARARGYARTRRARPSTRESSSFCESIFTKQALALKSTGRGESAQRSTTPGYWLSYGPYTVA